MTRVLEPDDVAELLDTVANTRWFQQPRADEDGAARAWRGAATLRWVERWRDTNGSWRRGNPYAWHRWGYGGEL